MLKKNRNSWNYKETWRLNLWPSPSFCVILPGISDHVSRAGELHPPMSDSLLFIPKRVRVGSIHFQDGGAVGSRRGDFNCVQYGIFPFGYTRRGKGHVLYFIPQRATPLLLVLCAFFKRKSSAWCLCELYTAHGKVTRGCNRTITVKNLFKKCLFCCAVYILIHIYLFIMIIHCYPGVPACIAALMLADSLMNEAGFLPYNIDSRLNKSSDSCV